MLRSIKTNNRLSSKAILSLLLICSLSVFAWGQTTASGLRGMAIVPVMYRAGGHAGSPLSLPIEIQNLEMRPLKVTLKINPVKYTDWTYGAELGTKSKFDCSDWFATKTFTTTIDKTSVYKIPLKCVIPKVEPGVYYCLGTIDPNIVGDSSTIIAQYQIPIIIFVGLQPKLDLKFGTPLLTATDKLSSVDIPFINDGDAFTVIGASVQIRDGATGRSIASHSDSDRNLYPQSKRFLHFAFPKLPDGQYQVQCTCQSGTRTFRPLTAAYIVKKGKAELATPGALISLPPFTVDPPRLHQAMPAGAQRMMVVKFTNQTDGPLVLNLTPHRLSQSSNGLLQVLEDSSLGNLIVTLSSSTVTIPPRRTANVRVQVASDPAAQGDSWFAISAVSQAGDSMSEEVYGSISIPNTGSPKIEIIPGETGKVGEIPISVDYEVSNTGNMALLPKVSASVLEAGLTPIAKLEVPLLGDGGILPGVTLKNRVMLPPNLKPGAYTVRLEYQIGEGLSEIKQIPFFVPEPKKTSAKKGKSGGK